MSQINQVVAIAAKLKAQDKPVTIAMLKSKLNSLPMPVLIQGLQRYKTMTMDEKRLLVVTDNGEHTQENTLKNTTNTQAMQQSVKQLEDKYQQLAEKYQQLEMRLVQLESKLENKILLEQKN